MNVAIKVLVCALLLLPACSDGADTANPTANPETSPSGGASQSRSITLRGRNGAPLPETVMRKVTARVTRGIALALQDSASRAALRVALLNSPYREQKIHLGDFLRSTGGRLVALAAERTAISHSAFLASLDSIVDLELYMPRKGDLDRWNGGDDVVVVSSLRDHDEPMAFDLKGNPVPASEATPPDEPALALVNVETDFSTSVNVPQLIPPDTSDGGGSPPPITPPSIPGIYLSYLSLSNLHEGFPRGDPEIEVCLLGRTPLSGTTKVAQAGICANEGGCPTCTRIFDQNSNTWQASPGSPGVLIASKTELNGIAALYPGTPSDSVPFVLVVVEDDHARGQIVDEDNSIQGIILGAGLAVAGIAIRVKNSCPQGQPSCPTEWLQFPGAIVLVAGIFQFGLGIYHAITGGEDDFPGTIYDARGVILQPGIPTVRSHAVFHGTTKVGEARLTWWP